MRHRQRQQIHPPSDPPVCVGIDVAKAPLEVAVRPQGALWPVPNDEAGQAERLARLARLVEVTPTRVVLEATGG
jgi:transposase